MTALAETAEEREARLLKRARELHIQGRFLSNGNVAVSSLSSREAGEPVMHEVVCNRQHKAVSCPCEWNSYRSTVCGHIAVANDMWRRRLEREARQMRRAA